ncbi:hypothetical protein CYMTET_24763 [Cymbomonas tetramitiformis]|uniref:WRKY19-like zinc finger domain-containing protein n=1 Tax=Cymbomonas tetramitiformis TaxID=36881 RepID=A0AAE0FV81_9CHLO|nr:hypothetical protein CYMTET_24763 [Cymbomonas tetramitiformis]
MPLVLHGLQPAETRSSPEAAQAVPPERMEQLLERQLIKYEPSCGWFIGRVVGSQPHSLLGRSFRIHYTDGNEEDMLWVDLCPKLLPKQPGWKDVELALTADAQGLSHGDWSSDTAIGNVTAINSEHVLASRLGPENVVRTAAGAGVDNSDTVSGEVHAPRGSNIDTPDAVINSGAESWLGSSIGMATAQGVARDVPITFERASWDAPRGTLPVQYAATVNPAGRGGAPQPTQNASAANPALPGSSPQPVPYIVSADLARPSAATSTLSDEPAEGPPQPSRRGKKTARGNTARGGGNHCEAEGCKAVTVGITAFCKAHGGGKCCQVAGCATLTHGGAVFCKAHWGGKCCQAPGCTKGVPETAAFCKAHMGSKRCQVDGCTKAARGGGTCCIGHGGGKRCQAEGCNKSAQGSTPLCVAHGGGSRCQIDGCGKSAQGGTVYCTSHGGGKRCHFEECPKAAEGRSLFCATHGGGNRCKAQLGYQ